MIFVYNGVLALEGEARKSRRTLLQPPFHRSSLSKLTEAMVESGRRHFDGLQEHGRAKFSIAPRAELAGLIE